MNKWHRILIVILVVQVAIAALVFWPRPAASGGQPILADLKAEDVARITITDAEDRHIELARSEGEWVLPGADDYPVQAESVDTLVEGRDWCHGHPLSSVRQLPPLPLPLPCHNLKAANRSNSAPTSWRNVNVHSSASASKYRLNEYRSWPIKIRVSSPWLSANG